MGYSDRQNESVLRADLVSARKTGIWATTFGSSDCVKHARKDDGTKSSFSALRTDLNVGTVLADVKEYANHKKFVRRPCLDVHPVYLGIAKGPSNLPWRRTAEETTM